MLKKLTIAMILVLSLVLISCGGSSGSSSKSTDPINVTDYMDKLSAKKTSHLKNQASLLMHPLQDAIELYGDDYEITLEGSYLSVYFEQANCSFEVHVGNAFEDYDWHSDYFDINDCSLKEYLPYFVIEKVILDGDGLKLTDGIQVGMSVDQISKKLKASGVSYTDGSAMMSYEYDRNGDWVETYYITGQVQGKECTAVFTGDILDRVELPCTSKYLPAQDQKSDHGKKIIDAAFAFVVDNELAKFDAGDLEYKGVIYSSHYGAWFDCWRFTQGDYAGYEINVEQAAPHRVYITAELWGFPFLFWQNGSYADPLLSFLGKWGDYTSDDYIDIKSISKEGIVVFDMYVEKDHITGEMTLLKNLSTPINKIPKTIDEYLFAEYTDDWLDGDMQLFNGDVQSGYYTYGGTRMYLIDSLSLDYSYSVSYIPRSLTGRVGCGPLSIHIPITNYDYVQLSSFGYMGSFGRDDPNKDNVILSGTPKGDAVINKYLNYVYSTNDLKYTQIECKYLYDYLFPVNNITYHVWERTEEDTSYYLYIDSTNEMIIKETSFNAVSRHAKELVFKDEVTISSKSYANQKFISPDGTITVDLSNRTITKAGAFAENIEFTDLGMDTEGRNERFMFFCDIGDRYALNGYILFDHTTWGATLHITDSNVPDYNIGVYYMNSETFFLDPSIGVISTPEDPKDDYIDDTTNNTIEESNQESKLVIRDFGGKIIGYIYVKENGDKTVKNFYGKILGYYYAERDVTTNFYGKILARGDIASALLFSDGT